MDPDTFLKSVNQPSPSSARPVRPVSPVLPTTPVPVAVVTPTISQPLSSSPVPKGQGFFKRHWIFYTAGIFLVSIFAAGTGTYYYYIHRAYSEDQILALIRTDIIPSVVQIHCADTDGGDEAWSGSGIYYLDPSTRAPMVVTNAHVVLGSDGLYHGCNVYFPRPSDGSFYDSTYVTGSPSLYHTLESNIQGQKIEGLDYAILPLTSAGTDAQGKSYPFPPVQADIFDSMDKICRTGGPVNIGDKIYLIGYPQTGGQSISLTQGVVSGFQGAFDEWIEVSAGITHGNSGGLAIGATNGCDYGIPSEGNSDGINTVGLVLSSSYISSFLDGLTGETTYAPAATTTDPSKYLTRTYDFPGFTMGYPDGWTIATSAPDTNGAWSVSFTAPSESALDNFNEQLVVYAYPNSTETDFTSGVSTLQSAVAALDPEAGGRYITLGGTVRTYQTVFEDSTQQSYSVPVLDYVIGFLKDGTLYDIESASQEGPNAEAYLLMFAGMGDSMRFK